MNHPNWNASRRLGRWLLASAVAAAALWVVAAPPATAPRARPLVADFTGEVASGGPVYRLPPLQVVARRSVELARIERDERAACTPGPRPASVPFPPLAQEVA
jgi:hypothetical protein